MNSPRNAAHGFGFAVDFGDDDGFATPRSSVGANISPQAPAMSKTAIGGGIAAALVCVGLLVPQISAVWAENTAGSTSFFLQENKNRTATRAAPVDLGVARFSPAPSQPKVRARIKSFAWIKPAPRVAHLNAAPAIPTYIGNGGKQSVCVRLCDGYFFPVGDLNSASEVPEQTAVCDNLCPGAPTRLYVMPSGSSSIEDAVSVNENKSYTALPVAFRHTTKSERTCSCHATESRPSSQALLKDFTLRKGDGVMTPRGIRLFAGAQHWPYKRNDFLSLADTRDLSGSDRGALAAIERVVRGQRQVVKASLATPAPALRTAAKTNATTLDANGNTIRIVGPIGLQGQ